MSGDCWIDSNRVPGRAFLVFPVDAVRGDPQWCDWIELVFPEGYEPFYPFRWILGSLIIEGWTPFAEFIQWQYLVWSTPVSKGYRVGEIRDPPVQRVVTFYDHRNGPVVQLVTCGYYVIGVCESIVEEGLIQASPSTAFLVLEHCRIGESYISIRIDEFTGGAWLSYVSIDGNSLCQVPVVKKQDCASHIYIPFVVVVGL